MFTLMFQIGQRKTVPSFGRFTPTLGEEFSLGLFFVYTGANLAVGNSFLMQRKRRVFSGARGLAPHFAPGWTARRSACPAFALPLPCLCPAFGRYFPLLFYLCFGLHTGISLPTREKPPPLFGLTDSFQIRPQLAHTPPTRPAWGFAGVCFPTRLPKLHTGLHRVEFCFTAFSWYTFDLVMVM